MGSEDGETAPEDRTQAWSMPFGFWGISETPYPFALAPDSALACGMAFGEDVVHCFGHVADRANSSLFKIRYCFPVRAYLVGVTYVLLSVGMPGVCGYIQGF